MACPTGVDAPPELRRFARGVLARARRDGLLRHGTAWGVPRTGTEQWPFAAAGVPSLGVADQVDEYMRVAYHTQHDRIELVDPECLADAIKVYARLVIAADRDPGGAARPGARARGSSAAAAASPALARCGVGTRAPARGARSPRGARRAGPSPMASRAPRSTPPRRSSRA